jgi:hypothetical protein
MKTFITFCCLVATTFTLKAQTLSFDETLAYLNKAVKDGSSTIKYGGMSAGTATDKPNINSNADMVVYLEEAVRSFGTVGYITAIEVDKKGGYGIVLDDDFPRTFNLFKLNKGFFLVEDKIVFSKQKREITYLQFVNEKEASRFYKALQHLNTFLAEEKDPFDN